MEECEVIRGDDGAVATWRLITGAVLTGNENRNPPTAKCCEDIVFLVALILVEKELTLITGFLNRLGKAVHRQTQASL